MALATLEKVLLVFAPISRTVPITTIISTTNIIAYSATSWPPFSYQRARKNFKTDLQRAFKYRLLRTTLRDRLNDSTPLNNGTFRQLRWSLVGWTVLDVHHFAATCLRTPVPFSEKAQNLVQSLCMEEKQLPIVKRKWQLALQSVDGVIPDMRWKLNCAQPSSARKLTRKSADSR